MTTRVPNVTSTTHDRPHPRRIRALGIIGALISIGLNIGVTNDTGSSDTSLPQQIDKINGAMNSFAERYAAKPIAPQNDNSVESENQDVFNLAGAGKNLPNHDGFDLGGSHDTIDATGYFAANENGYDYVIPAYWLWHYAMPAAAAHMPKDRKPLTWFLKGNYRVTYNTKKTPLLIPMNVTLLVPDWGTATAVYPGTDGCTKDPTQRRIQIDFPKRGDFVCVPVPTKPAIWVHNPNKNDVFMPMVAVKGCPKGLVSQVSNWPVPGDRTCVTPPQPLPSSDGLTPSSDLTSLQPCVSFKIILESGKKLDEVVLTTNDFEILKQNDHVFTVLPAKPDVITAVPTMGIHQLNLLIKQYSYTSVPDVPANDI